MSTPTPGLPRFHVTCGGGCGASVELISMQEAYAGTGASEADDPEKAHIPYADSDRTGWHSRFGGYTCPACTLSFPQIKAAWESALIAALQAEQERFSAEWTKAHPEPTCQSVITKITP